MQFELTIRGDSFEEIATIFGNDHVTLPPRDKPKAIKEIEPADAPLEEEEPEAPPAPKKPRGRKADAAKQGTPDTKSPPASSDGPTATTDASPSEEKVTFEDLRAAASSLMDSGKVDGRAIQDMLIGKFDVRAFGALKEEQYADALAELKNLSE
jgi:outer membrane biosynthesis protein TonB